MHVYDYTCFVMIIAKPSLFSFGDFFQGLYSHFACALQSQWAMCCLLRSY